MEQKRRQRDEDENDVAAPVHPNALPYDDLLITSIFHTLNDDKDLQRKDRFKALGVDITKRFAGQLDLPDYPSTFAQFAHCVKANNTQPLRGVAAAVVLINNNQAATPSKNDYLGGFVHFCGSITAADFASHFIREWSEIIAYFRTISAFSSFDSFAETRSLKDRRHFPICERCTILCHEDDTQPLHKNRFLDSGVWVNDSSLLRRTSSSSNSNGINDDRGLLSNLDSGVANFIGGESGSGKTCAAMLAGSDEITLFTHAKGGMSDVSGPHAEEEATNRFVEWITRCLQLPYPRDGKLSEIQFLGGLNESKIRTRWPDNPKHARSVLVVFDECGAFPNLRRCFSRLWPKFRTWLCRLLCCEAEEQIYLVMVGTGVENFEDPPGSLPSSYQVFTVRAPLLFADLLRGLKKHNDSSMYHPRMLVNRPNGMQRLAKALLKLLYEKYDHHAENSDEILYITYKAFPTDPATHRFLQLVSNPRCAALAVKEMRKVVADQNKNDPAWSVSLPAAAALLPWWSNSIARTFGQMNGLSTWAPSAHQKLDLIGAALFNVLTNAATLTKEQRDVLANKTGLLADTGFWIEESEFDATKHEKVPNVKPDVVKIGRGKNQRTEKYVYVFKLGAARFRMSAAHVALLLLGAGSILGGGSVVAADWKLFEAATADYIMLCWLLQIPAPNPSTFEHKRNDKTMSITFPAAAFAYEEKNNTNNNNNNNNNGDFKLRHVYRGILQHPLSDKSLTDDNNSNPERKKWFEEKKKQWKRMITEECGAIIFENISNAEFADVIAVSPRKVTLVQCKYYMKSTLNSKDATTVAFDEMMKKNPAVLTFLAECAGATPTEPCEVALVLAAGCPRAFNYDTEEKFVNRASKITCKPRLIGNVTAKITTAFRYDARDVPSLMFPVLQYPFDDDQTAVDNVINPVRGGELVSCHSLATLGQERCKKIYNVARGNQDAADYD